MRVSSRCSKWQVSVDRANRQLGPWVESTGKERPRLLHPQYLTSLHPDDVTIDPSSES
jgi:hypothetical protein